MNDDLIDLAAKLQPFSMGLRAPEMLSDLASIASARAVVGRAHSGAGIAANSETISSYVDGFRRSKELAGFRELKYVSLGVGAATKDGWCVLGAPDLLRKTLALAQGQREARRRLRCFQALLSSYWTFPATSPHVPPEALAGWRELRVWLGAEHGRLKLSSEQKPEWFDVLTKYAALLTDEPCKGFGEALLRGDTGPLRHAADELAIPATSWVHEEAVFAHVDAACRLRDAAFELALPDVLPVACGRAGLDIGDAIRNRCVARLTSRYARSASHPEHPGLRDAAIEFIGNPWLRKARWDSLVLDERRQPDDLARDMVDTWLKDQLIADFFELLSVDGKGDSRRVRYWQRYVPYIEDMWFALGSNARFRQDSVFQEFRSRAKGRILTLDKTTSDNNAFVMRMGRYLAVEYGAKGNACFFFEMENLSPALRKTLASGGVRAGITPAQIRTENHLFRLIHMDSSYESWEEKFDSAMHPRIGFVEGRRAATRVVRVPSPAPPAPERPRPLERAATAPVARQVRVDPPIVVPPSGELEIPYLGTFRPVEVGEPSREEWERFMAANTLQVLDNRKKGGALWVVGGTYPAAVSRTLESWGFRHRIGRGWFKE
jgi:hypothetical protein